MTEFTILFEALRIYDKLEFLNKEDLKKLALYDDWNNSIII